MHAKKTAFVVEHDFIMATYLADRVIVYDGTPGVETTAHTPQVRGSESQSIPLPLPFESLFSAPVFSPYTHPHSLLPLP